MNYVEIDGKCYDVLVTSISRYAEIKQSKVAGTSAGIGAKKILDPLGTFIEYTVTFQRRLGYDSEFDELWDCVIKPRYSGVWVNIVYNQTTLKYLATFSTVSQSLRRIDKKTGKIYWDELTVTCSPMEAQVLPSG